MLSAKIFREAATAALLNAESLRHEAKILVEKGCAARAAALAVIGVEECAKAVLYTLAAIFPEQSNGVRDRLKRHDVKHLLSANFEGAEIVVSEWALISRQQTGQRLSREDRLVDIFSDLAASKGPRNIVPAVDDAKKHLKSIKPEEEGSLSTPFIKDAAFYVDISSVGEVLKPERVNKYANSEIAGLEWDLDKLRALKEIVADDKRWEIFSGRVRLQC